MIFNVRISNTTKISFFFANFEKDFNLFKLKLLNKSTQTIIKKINTLKTIQKNIINMQKNRSYIKKKTFQLKKDKVFLFMKNLKTKKLNKKLNHIKIELFFIKN